MKGDCSSVNVWASRARSTPPRRRASGECRRTGPGAAALWDSAIVRRAAPLCPPRAPFLPLSCPSSAPPLPPPRPLSPPRRVPAPPRAPDGCGPPSRPFLQEYNATYNKTRELPAPDRSTFFYFAGARSLPSRPLKPPPAPPCPPPFAAAFTAAPRPRARDRPPRPEPRAFPLQTHSQAAAASRISSTAAACAGRRRARTRSAAGSPEAAASFRREAARRRCDEALQQEDGQKVQVPAKPCKVRPEEPRAGACAARKVPVHPAEDVPRPSVPNEPDVRAARVAAVRDEAQKDPVDRQ